MELSINLNYVQLLKLAKQLPYKYKKKLTREMEKDLKKIIPKQNRHRSQKNETKTEELNELQQFLLKGPVLTKFEILNESNLCR